MKNLFKAVGIVAIGLTVLITDAGASWDLKFKYSSGWKEVMEVKTMTQCMNILVAVSDAGKAGMCSETKEK